MFLEKLDGRPQMTTHEFFDFFRSYLSSKFDFMNGLTVDDFLWLRTHMADANLFDSTNQMETLMGWLSMISDMRTEIDQGAVLNLIKSIYAIREHRDTLVESSLENSVELVLKMLEIYVSGKGALL